MIHPPPITAPPHPPFPYTTLFRAGTAAVAAGDDAAAVQGQAAVPDLRRRARPGAHAAGAGHPETPWRQRVVLPGRQTDRAASRSGAADRVRRAPNRQPLLEPSAHDPPAAGAADRRDRPHRRGPGRLRWPGAAPVPPALRRAAPQPAAALRPRTQDAGLLVLRQP